MSHDEIRKLLGGYATNTLSEAERQALFEAALEDQDLFNELHEEQAMKELLADPATRDELRQALEKSAPGKQPVAWWLRWWAWSGAASAVAATLLIVTVTRWHTPESKPQYASVDAARPAAVAEPLVKTETDSKAKAGRIDAPVGRPEPDRGRLARLASPSAGKPAAPAPGGVPQNERKDELDRAAPAPPAPASSAAAASPPPAPSTQQVEVTAQAPAPQAVSSQTRASDSQAQSQQVQVLGQVGNSLRDQEQNQVRPAQLKSGVGGAIFSKSPPVIFSVVRRNENGAYQPLPAGEGLKTGDAVRLTAISITSGYLSLSRLDASGNWVRIFPATGPGLAVNANANYTLPDVPIDVQDTDQKLRLMLVPTAQDSDTRTGGFRRAAKEDRKKAKTALSKQEPAAYEPLVVDLTIGPKRVP